MPSISNLQSHQVRCRQGIVGLLFCGILFVTPGKAWAGVEAVAEPPLTEQAIPALVPSNGQSLQPPPAPRSARATINVIERQDSLITNDQQSCVEARKTSLPLYVWNTNGPPKGVVILVHGLFQHGECFSALGKHLAERGFKAFSLDLRGHGFWHFKHTHGQPGYYCDYQQTMNDVRSLASVLRDEYGDLPIFLLGESAGAAVVARCAARSPQLYDGVILCAFGTAPRAMRLRWAIEDVVWNMFRWDHEMQMRRYVKRFSSEDQRIVQESLTDPLCRGGVSLKEMLDTCHFVHKTRKVAERLAPDMPVLLVEGQDDQVFNPKSSGRFMAHVRSKLKQLVLIPHCGHVLVGTNYIKPNVIASIDYFLARYTNLSKLSREHLVASK